MRESRNKRNELVEAFAKSIREAFESVRLPPLLVNNEYIEDNNEKSKCIFYFFFCKQAIVDDS